jgi:LSD1 subclass zinc finger protein
MALKAQWYSDKREPQGLADPKYPHGHDFDTSGGSGSTCSTTLTYPAKGCGKWHIKCAVCQNSAMITTTGRVDDPKSIRMGCITRIKGAAPAPELKVDLSGKF